MPQSIYEIISTDYKPLLKETKSFETGLVAIPKAGEKGKLVVSTKLKQFSPVYLDYNYSKTIQLKGTLQKRTGAVWLLRFDFNGPHHVNPDGKTLPGTHIHVYKDSHSGASVAYECDEITEFAHLKTIDDYGKAFKEFCKICNIIFHKDGEKNED